MPKSALNAAVLSQFIGTERWHRHALNTSVLFTEGAKYVADHAGAYWLLDEIALTQLSNQRVAAEEFQVWKLSVNSDRTADIICEDGNNNIVYIVKIPFTDFPEGGITFWYMSNTILLPSEY